MPTIHSTRSINNVLADLFVQFTALMRKESELARTELSEKVGHAGTGLVSIVLGAVLLIPALVILLEAAVDAIEQAAGLPSYWASLAVGGGVLLLGLILLMVGVSKLRVKNLVPKKTIHQFQEGVAAVAGREASASNGYERAA